MYVCTDCAVALETGDYSGMEDYQAGQTRKGIERLSNLYPKSYLTVGESVGFKYRGCDCCQDGLAGDKFELEII
jgi:hypothetical protein